MTEIKTKCVESSKLGGEGAGYRAVAGGWAVYQLLMPLSRVGGGGSGRRTQQEHSEPLQASFYHCTALHHVHEGRKKETLKHTSQQVRKVGLGSQGEKGQRLRKGSSYTKGLWVTFA